MALVNKKSSRFFNQKFDNGFTLVELVMVTVVIGIMAAFAVPNFMDWLPNMRLKAAARDLYSNMQKARMMAVKFNRNTAIIFDTSNNEYKICNNWNSSAGNCTGTVSTVDLSKYRSGVGYGHGSATKQANSTGSNFPLSPDDDVSFLSPVNTAIFNGTGLSNSGYVYLDHEKHSTTYAVGCASSGVIKLLKWNGSAWK